MKSAPGPYMQNAGRGNMPKTGRGKEIETLMVKGPHLREPGHGTDSDPAKNYERSVNDYQPKYNAGPVGEPAPLVGPSPYKNPDTGQESSFAYNSATIPGLPGRGDGFGSNLGMQRITAESQQRARSGQSGGNLKQKYFTKGKDIYDSKNRLVTDFTNISRGRPSMNEAARNNSMNISNVNQGQINQTIREGIKNKNANTKFKNAVKLKDMAFDVVKRDSSVVSNANRVFEANADYEKNAPTVPSFGANNVLQQRTTQQRSTQPRAQQTSVIGRLVKDFAKKK